MKNKSGRFPAHSPHTALLLSFATILLVGCSPSATELRFAAHTISTSAHNARSVFAADVDGDGDMDVLSASWSDNKIAWYENNGRSRPSFTEHVISTTALWTASVFAADVNGDGDMDVLSASYRDNKIAWYENDGASPPSFTERVISTVALRPYSVFAADADGDGDMDVLSIYANTIYWHENDGASPPSFTERVISTAHFALSVFAADVDGDGDMDVLAASSWYENDGGSPPSFTQRIVSTTAGNSWPLYAADVDGDGDVDVLSSSGPHSKIAWYENDGASPPSFTERVISTAADAARSVFAADVDGDGDMDVLSASKNDDKIAWYENDGASPPSFTERVISTTALAAWSVFAADVDGDGDMDVLSASWNDNKIAWYENK